MENQEQSKDRESFGDTAIADRAKTLKDATATDKSKILTHVYEKMMKIFRTKWLPEKEVINLSWEFMRQNGAKIQKDIQEHVDPTVLQTNIGIHANQFLLNVGASVADRKYNSPDIIIAESGYKLPSTKLSNKPSKPDIIEKDPVAPPEEISPKVDVSSVPSEKATVTTTENIADPQDPDPMPIWDTSSWESPKNPDEWNNQEWDLEKERERGVFATYSENRDSQLDFIAENHFDPNETSASLADASRHPQHIDDTRDISSVRDDAIDSPSEIANSIENLSIGDTRKFDFPFEWGVTEMILTRQPNNDIICQWADNIEIRISAEENPEKMLEYYSEIMCTPIVRRLLMGGIDKFEKLRKRLSQKNAAADSNPEAFIDMVLLSLSEKIKANPIIENNIKWSEILAQWNMISANSNIQGKLSENQGYLLAHRDQLLNSLRIAKILPESGVQRINPEVIL